MSLKPTLYRSIILSILTLCCSLGVGYAALVSLPELTYFIEPQVNDSTQSNTIYPVSTTVPKSIDDIGRKGSVDLINPENLNSVIEFDAKTNSYVFRTLIGDMEVGTPFSLSSSEYQKYQFENSMKAYFRDKSTQTDEERAASSNAFDPLDMRFSLGPAEKIFGPGGVQLKTQGSAELSFGVKNNKVDNPTLPERARSKTYLDFQQQIQLNMNAKVGDKLDFNMNYNTNATFDFDAQKIKLNYQGKEDEIIKSLEAGNVSMSSSGGLIRGTQALFGVKAALQFGKFKITGIVAQQESESKVVNTQGGAQTTSFEFSADNYDENRHYFLAHFFRDGYDKSMSKLPYISSGVIINKIEVWVTNKRGNFDDSRNVIAFMDLAETERIGNSFWTRTSSESQPDNNSNSLFSEMNSTYSAIRDISAVNSTLSQLEGVGIFGGRDYDKIENARKLDPSEYFFNKQLGYLSLRTAIQPDEVLGVAYEYTYAGRTFQVGEFASDNNNSSQALFVKLLRSTGVTPDIPLWHLMMKNVYSLNAYQVQQDRFRLDIQYQSDTTGIYLNYLPESSLKNEILLRLMNLDRLDSRQELKPDGYFDFVEGFTVQSQNGRVYFPVIEPFGSHLKSKIGNDAIASNYVFQELYDSTLTVAQQIAEKNKFRIKGEYRSSSGAEIRLNAMNVPRGSVKVTAGGQELSENSDYSVDYTMGVVTILNTSILDSGTPISVQLENQSMFSMQRKTLLGFDASYAFTENFNVGATVMHLNERPLTQKVNMGDESISNTIWGLNTQYSTQSQWLTDMVDKLPFVNATAPSTFSLNAEFAHLIPGHPKELEKQGVSYIDDFESTKISIDLRNPYSWSLASTPWELPNALYPNRTSNDGVDYYGKNRSLIAWYYIDAIFTRKNSNLTPTHIKNDREQLSDHRVREVLEREIFPNKENAYGEPATQTILNLAYYPNERGPYNLDHIYMGSDGFLQNPQQRWGGIMRKLDNTDFEASNIEYIEFWMMDPFITNSDDARSTGGELYFNIGELSEDILKDGKKFYENGMPIDGDESLVENTYWGKVPRRQSTVYAFDNSAGARKYQDVGLNGLRTEEEFEFSTYRDYLDRVNQVISGETRARWELDLFSPLNDPAGDNYHYYRGSDYDRDKLSILQRYKRYNGTEGNSPETTNSTESYGTSARVTPDVEDINQDNTLNDYERYFQYKVELKPERMQVGDNYIVDRRTSRVTLRNGKQEDVNWYQFKIPVRDYQKAVGNIRDFKSIRFMRMFMTDFQDSTVLRFATLELVRGEWRQYEQALYTASNAPITDASIDVSAVNIEENASREPVNYVLPPGVSRIIDPSQPQLRQLNEQSLSMRITNLAPADARAVYKNSALDVRQYKRIQMYVHAEAFIDDITDLRGGEISAFIRMGSDYKNNYYEYEIPLSVTPHGTYSNNNSNDRLVVWPENNQFDFPFEIWTNLKLERNKEKRQSGSTVTFQTPYSSTDPEKPRNKITVVGNPTLSEAKVIMIGVRNNSRAVKSGEIWVNELRLTEFNEDGGWAIQGSVNLALSDIGNVNFSGRRETAGFGGVEQSVNERRLDDFYQYNLATSVDVGRFLPSKVKVKAPLYYSYSEQVSTPKYNPLDQDIYMSEALDEASTRQERDSIKRSAQDVMKSKSFSLSSVKIDIQSKKPMPYDPANLTMSYSYTGSDKHSPSVSFENSRDYRGSLSYSYTPMYKGWVPFAKISSKSKYLVPVKDITLNYLPQNISFNTSMNRYYFETQLRDLNADGSYSDALLSYRKDFLWDREFNLRWDFTKTIKFNLRTGTNARIDEPDGRVSKNFLPDEYELWKDTVMQSIASFGTPYSYAQAANLSWDVPINKIPVFDWTTLNFKYASTYNWDRGASIEGDTELGNILKNNGNLTGDLRLNFENLYNKSNFLRETNKKFASSGRGNSSVARKPDRTKVYSQKLRFKKGEMRVIRHSLNNREVRVEATMADSTKKVIPVKFKVRDQNSIQVTMDSDCELQVRVSQKQDNSDKLWYKTAQYSSRALMLIRNTSVSYRRSSGLILPSFKPFVGDMFGQKGNNGAMAPGLDFAFGLTGEGYIDRALANDWLIVNDSVVSPAMSTFSEDFQLQANLEPFRGFKVVLNANRVRTQNAQISFMVSGMPRIESGNLTMTFIALRTSLRGANAKGGYRSENFERFLSNRAIIANRLQSSYAGSSYPSGGFMEGNILGGKPYDPNVTPVNANSPDVLIPAFIAAYSGRSADRVGLSAFPSLLSLLPNWRITYDGLMQIGFFKKKFKTFNLQHSYRCTYGVGSYNTFSNYLESEDGFGYIKEVASGNPVPSSMYDITSVNISESFNPLIGVDMTFKNNITARAEYKDTRNLSLNIGSNQIVEALSNEVVVGMGYNIPDLKIFYKAKGGKLSSFKNEMKFRADISYRVNQSLIRKIEEAYTQPTSGTSAFVLKLSADYTLSRAINLRAFYDKQVNKPLVSSSAFPVSNSSFGVSVRLTLTR